jgi:hypothetical protein
MPNPDILGKQHKLGDIMTKRANEAMAAIAAKAPKAADRTKQTNAAIAAKASFDAQVANVTNRFNTVNSDITVIVPEPDITVTAPKSDIWNKVGKAVKPGEYVATMTTPDTSVNLHITVNADGSVIRRIAHWTR